MSKSTFVHDSEEYDGLYLVGRRTKEHYIVKQEYTSLTGNPWRVEGVVDVPCLECTNTLMLGPKQNSLRGPKYREICLNCAIRLGFLEEGSYTLRNLDQCHDT